MHLPIPCQMNAMFKLGTFPAELERAKVTTYPKIGIKHNTNNYRLNSILPIISRVVEGAIGDVSQVS